MQKRPAIMACAPVLQPSPSLGVKLIWWKVKSTFWVTSIFALLPHISQWKISCTLQWCLPISILSEMSNPVPFKRGKEGVCVCVWGCVYMYQENVFLYGAGISPPLGKLQTVGMCIWNMYKHIAMSKQYLKNQMIHGVGRMLYICKFKKCAT